MSFYGSFAEAFAAGLGMVQQTKQTNFENMLKMSMMQSENAFKNKQLSLQEKALDFENNYKNQDLSLRRDAMFADNDFRNKQLEMSGAQFEKSLAFDAEKFNKSSEMQNTQFYAGLAAQRDLAEMSLLGQTLMQQAKLAQEAQACEKVEVRAADGSTQISYIKNVNGAAVDCATGQPVQKAPSLQDKKANSSLVQLKQEVEQLVKQPVNPVEAFFSSAVSPFVTTKIDNINNLLGAAGWTSAKLTEMDAANPKRLQSILDWTDSMLGTSQTGQQQAKKQVDIYSPEVLKELTSVLSSAFQVEKVK
jgi:hypothetical protein